MRLGFLTSCLPDQELAEIVVWAADAGYEALEVAAWPSTGNRPFTAAHIEVEGLTEDGAGRINELVGRHGLTLSALAYYDNNLHPDSSIRAENNAHVRACIDAAIKLSIPAVGTLHRTRPEQERHAEPERG